MNPQVVSVAPIRVVMIRHRGPYEGVSAAFDQLAEWVERNQISTRRTIGIYWDNPDFVPSGRLRSAACMEVDDSFQLGATDGLRIELSTIAGGQYVTKRCVGPYEHLAAEWTRLTTFTEGALRRTISENPAFEVYVNDASTTPPDRLITELFMPVL